MPKLSKDDLSPTLFEDQDIKTLALEQYKLLVGSINKSNDVRELSNGYWITVNTLGVSAAAYIKDSQTLSHGYKPLVLWFIILLGVVLCLAWLNFLITITHNIETRNNLLIKIEKHFPFKIFTQIFSKSGRQQGKGSLTIKEMILPCLFLISYLALGYFLLFYQSKVVQG